MNRPAVWLFLLIAGLAMGPARANPCALPGDGMGGTGMSADGGGIGGTGLRPADRRGDGSGMGGTGRGGDGSGMGGTGGRADGTGTGGTGVVGVVTGFASICVNGLEVFYGAETPVTVDGESASTEALAVGQVVSVWAVGRDGRLHARHVAVTSALVGPVSWVAADGRALVAMGQFVRLPPAGEKPVVLPRVGDSVRVSGLRDAEGAVRATRVERVADLVRPGVSGTVDLVAGKLARVGNLLVRGLPGARAGDQVRVTGILDNGILQVRQSAPDPLLAPLRGVERFSLQGVAAGSAARGGLSLGYADIAVPAGMPAIAPGSVVRVEARARPDGGLELARIIEVRDGGDRPRDSGEPRGRQPTGSGDGGQVRHPVSPAAHVPASGAEDRRAARQRGDAEGRGERRSEGRDEIERPESGRVERPEMDKPVVEKVEVEKIEKPETEKVEKPEVEKIEKPEVEKVEIEKVEIEKVEVEKPEKPEKPEKAEKPEKHEKEERHERH